MQAVIVLGRALRDKHTLPIKVSLTVAYDSTENAAHTRCRATGQTPLKEIVVFHPEQEYLDDIASLQQYISEELNVRQITLSSDEAACGVKWKVDADWPVLGKKLRKDLPRLKKALPTVTSEQVKEYLTSGEITIDGIKLVAGDLTTQRFVELPAPAAPANGTDGAPEVDAAQYSSDSNSDVVILLDVKMRPDFILEAYAREVVNRVQRARKRAGCQATDDIEVYFAYSHDDEAGRTLISQVLNDKKDIIMRVLKSVPQDDRQRDQSRPVFYRDADEDEQEVGGAKFKIVLLEAGK